jgi:hypothetical protein
MRAHKVVKGGAIIVMVLSVFAFTNLQPQKNSQGNKDNKEQGGSNGNMKNGDQGDHGKGRGNNGQSSDNNAQKQNTGRGNHDNSNNNNNNSDNGHKGGANKGDHERSDNHNQGDKASGRQDHGKSGEMHGNTGKGKNDDNGKGKQVKFWKDGEVDWNFNNFADRKSPRDQKKVTICHHTGDEFPVTINVSENAVKAHMNHGDQTGGCNINYSDRWTPDYIRTRENVYNTYEQTWETMSYSEALLRYAAEKLLGVRSNLDRTRVTLNPQEVQRREALILDLQNNVDALQMQLDQTRQRTDDVNIIIQL